MKLFKKNKMYFIIILIVVLFIGGGLIYYFNISNKTNKFDLDVLFLKMTVEEGGSAVNYIKVQNTDSVKNSFAININEVNDLIELKERKFDLNPNEEKNIEVIFETKDFNEGVYVGELEIISDGEIQTVPVVLEIQSKEVFFDSNIDLFPKGQDIISGEKINSEIKIFDLSNVGKTKVKLDYFIKDFKGGTIVAESEDLIIDGDYAFFKTLNLPKSVNVGNYVLVVIIDYKDSIGTSSEYFKIIDEEEKNSSEDRIVLIIFVFSFFFLIFLGLFIYSLYSRNNLLREIQKQYRRELRRQEELIKCREVKDFGKLKNVAEKREYKREIKKVKKKRVKVLNELKRKKIKEFKRIKGKKNVKNLKRQIENWKKKGYDTRVLEKYKMPEVRDIRARVRNWKKKGYDTRILEKKK
ncbi:hypothetical protein HOE04_01270 [archaeon]|jgi:hypothetical protein|nr:hypothetical protein [archaeon]